MKSSFCHVGWGIRQGCPLILLNPAYADYAGTLSAILIQVFRKCKKSRQVIWSTHWKAKNIFHISFQNIFVKCEKGKTCKQDRCNNNERQKWRRQTMKPLANNIIMKIRFPFIFFPIPNVEWHSQAAIKPDSESAAIASVCLCWIISSWG